MEKGPAVKDIHCNTIVLIFSTINIIIAWWLVGVGLIPIGLVGGIGLIHIGLVRVCLISVGLVGVGLFSVVICLRKNVLILL